MLSRVLLHVIEAALPVEPALHLALHLTQPYRGPYYVRDPVAFVHHILDRRAGDRACVEQLPSRSGIERRAVEIDPPAIGRLVHHTGAKLGQIRIGIIQALGHFAPTFPAAISLASMRVRRRSTAGVNSLLCEIPTRYSGIAQRSSSAVIQWIGSKRRKLTGRE